MRHWKETSKGCLISSMRQETLYGLTKMQVKSLFMVRWSDPLIEARLQKGRPKILKNSGITRENELGKHMRKGRSH